MKKKKFALKGQGPVFIMTTVIVTEAKYPKVATTIGVAQLESSEDGTYLMDEHLQSLEARITTAEKADKDLAAANTAIDGHKAKITDLEARIATAEQATAAAKKEANDLQASLTAANTEIEELKVKLTGKEVDDPAVKRTGTEGGAQGNYSWTKKRIGG